MNNEIIQNSEKYALFNKTTPNKTREISYHDFHCRGFIHPVKDGVFLQLVDSLKQIFWEQAIKKQWQHK